MPIGTSPLQGSTQSLGSAVGSAAITSLLGGEQSLLNGVTGGINSSLTRLGLSGLSVGGVVGSNGGISLSVKFNTNTQTDWRLRLSLPSGANYFYNDKSNKIMSPLLATGGVIFPYTPTVTITNEAMYESQPLTHSNYPSLFYRGSQVQDISIQGDFSVQSNDEGQYLLAVVQFFRAATKMFYGQDTNPIAGNPPPVLFLDGYGTSYFPHVACVVKTFTHTMPADVDYVEVPIAGQQYFPMISTGPSTTWVPTQSQIQISIQPVFSRQSQTQTFSLSKFASGGLLGKAGAGGTGDVGGFI